MIAKLINHLSFTESFISNVENILCPKLQTVQEQNFILIKNGGMPYH